MIEINLLPSGLREKKKVPVEQLFQKKSILTILGALILLHLFLYAVTSITAKRLNILERNWQGLSPKRAELSKLSGELTEIDKKVPLIDQLISNRILWSKKLNEISDLLVPGVWLNELSLQKKEMKDKGTLDCLVIRGSAASRTKNEPVLIAKTMQSLKDSSSFSADFAEIELGPIKKKLIKQTEIMDFILISEFKRKAVKTLPDVKGY
jgi:hypothetical protein